VFGIGLRLLDGGQGGVVGGRDSFGGGAGEDSLTAADSERNLKNSAAGRELFAGWERVKPSSSVPTSTSIESNSPLSTSVKKDASGYSPGSPSESELSEACRSGEDFAAKSPVGISMTDSLEESSPVSTPAFLYN